MGRRNEWRTEEELYMKEIKEHLPLSQISSDTAVQCLSQPNK